MKNAFFLLGFFCLSLNGLAQSTGTVSGSVQSENGKAYAAATIQLCKAADSAVLKMAISREDGRFVFENIALGNYLVIVSATGHTKTYSNVFALTGSSIAISPVTLLAKSSDLKAVTVVASKPLVEQKIDRMVVNVEASVSNIGATALEVLEKSPGITVDKDGNISLKGKQGVQVYIDGKPAYLSGAELVNLLRNMSATQLDQVEIMTNPPAKYDAAGNSGIINLKTKKNKVKGFNGSVTAGYSQGIYWRTNESLNMNYRNGRFNAFMNYNFNRNNSFEELMINRIYKKEDGKTVDAIFDQVAFMPRSSSNHNLKLGVDYYLTNKTTFGIVTSGFINPSSQHNFNTSYLKDALGTVDSIVKSTSHGKERWRNGTVNLNFRHQFDSTGRELTADLDFSRYASSNDQLFNNTSFEPNGVKKGQTDLHGDLPVDINIYTAKVDYTHPLKKGVKLEAGAKTSYVNTINAANYFFLQNGEWEIDFDKTNSFKYNENINAAYVNMSKQFKKFGVQAGLRFENTNYKGHQLGNAQKPDSSFSRTYNSLFPTIYLSYEANKNNQFGLSAGRRIDRPAYQSLNPFLFFLDNYTYEAGNPFLKPQYTGNLELSHTYMGFLTTTLNYSRTKNFFMETFEQSDYATIVRQGNIGVRENAGISISAQIPVTKWWNSSVYTNYNYSSFSGKLYGEELNVEASNVLVNVNNQFRFKKGWSAELGGFYRSRGIEGQIVIYPMSQITAGVSKQVLKGKGTVRFTVRDIFYTNWAKGHIDFQQTAARFENRRDSRVGSIAFTYRFGKPLKNNSQQKRGGASDEQNRVKMNN